MFGEGLRIVLKLFWLAQVTLLTQLGPLVARFGGLFKLVRFGEDASSACSRLYQLVKMTDVFLHVITLQDGRHCRLLHFVKMADVVAFSVFRDVIAILWR